MAQLKDLIVTGSSRLIGDTFTNKIQITTLNAPTSAGGTTYGPGTNGYVLKSNGSSIYWGTDTNSLTGVKGNAESSYRTGNVNLTPANILGTGNTGQFWRGDNTWNNELTGSAGANVATLGLKTSATIGNNQYAWGINHLAANINAEGNSVLITGKSNSSNNSAALEFHYVADNSDNNYVGLGLYGNNHLLKVYKTGNVSIGNSNNSYKLEVAGTSCFTDNLRVVSNGIWVQGGSNAGSNNSRMTLTSGMPTGLQYNSSQRGTRIYSNAIGLADPYNGNSNNDSGWLRHIEETANSGILEIGVGDDGNEQIVARQYNTSSAIAAEIKLLDASHNTILRNTLPITTNTYTLGNDSYKWASLYATTSYGALSGTASNAIKSAQDESGNNIKASYAASISISDHTITLKNKNGVNLGTVTVPDNDTWKVNTSSSEGYVTSAANQQWKVWGTDKDKTPAWRNPYEASLQWGGPNYSYDVSPIGFLFNDKLRGNRFAALSAASVTIQYSTDGGSTWTDYGASNSVKQALFTQGSSLRLVPSGNVTANNKLQIIVNTSTAPIYTLLKKFLIYITTNYSSGSYVTIDAALQSDPDNYTLKICENQSIAGWSGWNEIQCNFTTYGNTAGSQYGRIRFTFGHTGITSGQEANGLTILNIRGYGGVGWTSPSVLASYDRPYTYNEVGAVNFMNSVTATTFTGNLNGNAVSTTKLQTARAITITDAGSKITGAATNFDGSANIALKLPTRIMAQTDQMIVSAGKVYYASGTIQPAKTATLYADGLAITSPATYNDVGWIRVTGTGEADTVLEIATGDDGGGANSEKIVVRKYNTGNSVTNEAVLLNTDATTSFPVSVTSPKFIGALQGNADTTTKLATARTINGTSFDGTANITTTNWGTTRTLTIGSTGKSVDGSTNVSWSLSEIGAAASSHTHTINQITWPSGQNLTTTNVTANNQEWSIDLQNTDYTGTYWHVWSGKNSASILSCYNDDRKVTIPVHLSVGGYDNTSYALSTSSFISNSWIRTKGATGWYNEDYGGGWYMSDSSWIRSYGNKSIYQNSGTLRTDGTFQVGADGNYVNFNSSGLKLGSATATSNGANLLTINGHIVVNAAKNTSNSYSEGIRINNGSNNWATLALGGDDTSTSGTGKAVWGLFVNRHDTTNKVSNLYISNNGSSGATMRITGHVTNSAETGWSIRPRLGIGQDPNASYALAVTGNNYFSGQSIGTSMASSWLDGQRYQRGAFNIADYSNTGSYNPWMRATNTWASGSEDAKVGKWFSFGTLGTSFYWIGSSTTRTANSYDYGMSYNIANGQLTVTQVNGTLNGNANTASTATWSIDSAHATTAHFASTANTATTAGYATTASQAIHAATANSATTATEATHAATANSATTAGYATTASQATHAATANTASTAGFATTASYATDTTKVAKAGDTMTGQLKTSFKSSVAMGSYQATATTIPDLIEELRYSSGCCGSVNLTTAYTGTAGGSIATGWYNFFYIPHRSGGVNGAASGDNCNYGTLILCGMTMGSQCWRIRFASSAIAESRRIWNAGDAITGAVWNDYAEYREADTIEPGYVVTENGNDTLSKTTKRLQPFAGITSDTWGFAQGKTDKAQTPIAVAGRVLVYTSKPRNRYKPGQCVCADKDGKIDIMHWWEKILYPDRIVGTVSCVPDYEEWGGGEGADRPPVKINNRIWIKVK